MKFGLKEEIIDKINRVFKKYPRIEKAVLYGSRAKGDFKNGSDIDLVLYGEQLDISLLHKINLEIDDLLLPYSFDISAFDQINNPDLIDHIKRKGVLFYSFESE